MSEGEQQSIAPGVSAREAEQWGARSDLSARGGVRTVRRIMEACAERDAQARSRDQLAAQRDRAADAREPAMAWHDAALAAVDRHAAARDRAEAARDRVQALADREDLLRATQYGRDEDSSCATLSLAVGGGLFAPVRARAALHALVGDVGAEQLELLELLVSELVTNSVVHGGASPEDKVTVQITVGEDKVRGEVTDPGPGFNPADPPRPRASGGLGLVIVDRVTDRWGTSDDGRRVWFELKRGSPNGRLFSTYDDA